MSSTQPWNENPWSPDVFKVKRHAGFRSRFVDKDNVERRKDEGWIVADAADYGIDVKEGDGTVLKRRGMILMEMPEELARQRDAYMAKKTQLQTSDIKTQVKGSVRAISSELGSDVEVD